MRKLTTFCCLTTAIITLFMACQKDGGAESSLNFTQASPPSVSSHVVALTNQNLDYQHFQTHQNPNEAVQPTPTLNNAARLILTYFNLLGEEKEKTYTSVAFKSALIESGLSEKEAERRTERIFASMHCSPTYLTETARLLSPTLPPHTEGAFICELTKPYDFSQIETFLEKNVRNIDATAYYKKNSLNERVKEVNKLVGVSGSIAAYGDNRIELFIKTSENGSSTSQRINYQDVRLVLQEVHGYTEGEAIYLKLILGGLTEQEVWLLFETEILPILQKNNKITFEKTNSLRMERLYFRYNYVEITGSTGRLGYTVYDLDGFTD